MSIEVFLNKTLQELIKCFIFFIYSNQDDNIKCYKALSYYLPNATGTTLRTTNKNFQDGELPHEFFLIIRQKTKARKTLANNMSTEIKLSKAKLSKIRHISWSFVRQICWVKVEVEVRCKLKFLQLKMCKKNQLIWHILLQQNIQNFQSNIFCNIFIFVVELNHMKDYMKYCLKKCDVKSEVTLLKTNSTANIS